MSILYIEIGPRYIDEYYLGELYAVSIQWLSTRTPLGNVVAFIEA